MNSHRFCVIMCGGIGSRFWPYSRINLPKQFIDFFGIGRSLLQMSYDRIRPLVPVSNIIVVTNAAYVNTVARQLPDIPLSNILAEPERRNTAPCIAWAAHHIYALDSGASMVVTPSDHVITGERMFEQCLCRGFDFVENNNALLTLGIRPTRPETGYGYIQTGAETTPDGILKVKTFTEKPDYDLAKVFVESGEFLWNSGIFLWRADTILNALREYAPDLARRFDVGSTLFGTEAEVDFIRANFPACPAISIDYSVMEKSRDVYVERAEFGWNDLGTWGALFDQSPRNRDGNVAQNCRTLTYNTSGCIIAERNPDKLIVVTGLHDYIIADTDNVLLIHPKSEEQSIRQIVNDVESQLPKEFL